MTVNKYYSELSNATVNKMLKKEENQQKLYFC